MFTYTTGTIIFCTINLTNITLFSYSCKIFRRYLLRLTFDNTSNQEKFIHQITPRPKVPAFITKSPSLIHESTV